MLIGSGARMSARGDRLAWLGMHDSNSEMSSQIIPLKGGTDFRCAVALAIEHSFRTMPCDVRPNCLLRNATTNSRRIITEPIEPCCVA
jgi:hypothetical protein